MEARSAFARHSWAGPVQAQRWCRPANVSTTTPVRDPISSPDADRPGQGLTNARRTKAGCVQAQPGLVPPPRVQAVAHSPVSA